MPNKHNLTSPTATEPLDIAIDEDAYEYLEANAGYYLTAIERALASGMTPEQIRAYIMRKAPDRPGLAHRCAQAASHIQRMAA